MKEHRWVADQAALRALVGELADQPVYAVDTEFHRERTYYPRAAVVQVAWADGVALVDPLAVDLAPLADVVGGPGLAVMHAAAQDLEVLDHEVQTIPTRLFDTQVAAGFLGFSTPSLGSLVRQVLDEHLPKAGRLTDWLRRPLDEVQLAYAAEDVRHLLALHDALAAELDRTGRDRWVDEECERLRSRARAPVVPEEAWWRIKEASHLRGRSRAVAQALGAWRERRARTADRPVRTVLPDLALVTIASDPPATAGDLSGRRGVEQRFVKGKLGEEVLAAVREGLAMPDSAVRLPPRDDVDRHLRPAVTLVSAWVSQLGRDLMIDPSLLATRADVTAFLRGDPSRLAEGWRADLVGGAVRRLVDGEAALAFEGRGRLVLETRSGHAVTVDLPLPTAPWASG